MPYKINVNGRLNMYFSQKSVRQVFIIDIEKIQSVVLCLYFSKFVGIYISSIIVKLYLLHGLGLSRTFLPMQ